MNNNINKPAKWTVTINFGDGQVTTITRAIKKTSTGMMHIGPTRSTGVNCSHDGQVRSSNGDITTLDIVKNANINTFCKKCFGRNMDESTREKYIAKITNGEEIKQY